MKYTIRKGQFFDKQKNMSVDYTQAVVYATVNEQALVGVITPLYDNTTFVKNMLKGGAGTAELKYKLTNSADGNVKESAIVVFADGTELAVKVTFDGINILKLIDKSLV